MVSPATGHDAGSGTDDVGSATRGAIDLLDVTQAFGRPNRPVPVLDHVDLSVTPGSFVSLIGPSGCGKSTLLRLVAGLDQPVSGRVYVDGRRVTGPSPSRGLVFQDPTLLPWLTVERNVGLGPHMRGLDAEAAGRVDAMLEMVGLDGFRDALPSQLSGGMAQRVSLARALVNQPDVLLLDEPLGKLDALTRSSLQNELARLWHEQGFTALMVTHDVDEALLLSDDVIVFSPRPARVLERVTVDLDRPRNRDTPAFAALRRDILRVIT